MIITLVAMFFDAVQNLKENIVSDRWSKTCTYIHLTHSHLYQFIIITLVETTNNYAPVCCNLEGVSFFVYVTISYHNYLCLFQKYTDFLLF